jgi:hypothetical protein
MSKKEVEEHLDMLKKALAEKQPEDNVVSILTKLKDGVAATEELLRVCANRFPLPIPPC